MRSCSPWSRASGCARFRASSMRIRHRRRQSRRPRMPVAARDRRQSERKEELHEVALLLVGEAETEEGIVVIHHVIELRKPAVVVEASLLVSPQAGQRCGPIAERRRAVRLEAVDSNLGGRMDGVPRLRVKRRDMAGRALRLVEKESLAASGRGGTERAFRWFRSGNRELVIL